MNIVIKNDGSTEPFDVNKIINSIVKAWNNVGVPDSGWAVSLAIDLQNKVWASKKDTPSSWIREEVDTALMKEYPHVAREYITIGAVNKYCVN